jgi:Mce-associated membrane protein
MAEHADTADELRSDVAELPVAAATGDARAAQPRSVVRTAAVLGAVIFLALGGLISMLWFTDHQANKTNAERQLFLQTARQGALNFTTIDWQHADDDIKRILDSGTGKFHEEFLDRSQPFVDTVKKAQSKSVGTITEAGLESMSGDDAQALVTVSVKTWMPNQADAPPRSWRMRISLHKINNKQAKISDVLFVS